MFKIFKIIIIMFKIFLTCRSPRQLRGHLALWPGPPGATGGDAAAGAGSQGPDLQTRGGHDPRDRAWVIYR